MNIIGRGLLLVALLFFLSPGGAVAREERELRRGKEKTWLSLCKCAPGALADIRRVLRDYTQRLTTRDPLSFDLVVGNVTEIAYNCTKTPECRCPEGYFKTRDGNSCLKISEDKVDCNQAVEICARDSSSRLAIAKDDKGLTKLADYIRELDPTDKDFYWIGLSYNSTDKGRPLWTWEDGSAASYTITSNLKNNIVRKSLLSVNGGPQAVERVAISKDYEGAHWRQERCGSSISTRPPPKLKYICEFTMFKVNIQAVTADVPDRKHFANAGLGRK